MRDETEAKKQFIWKKDSEDTKTIKGYTRDVNRHEISR